MQFCVSMPSVARRFSLIRLRDNRLLFTCVLYLIISFQVPSDDNKRHHFNRCCIMEISRE